ncbi:MAG: tetratricopeptide repeat protein [Chloroflexi bacterium]|nr:tetratricopeptide repeat protein [Chloroflexota bacterium]
MTYQEEEQARLKRHLSKQAIALAMQGRWQEAIAANREIIDYFANDVDAYNRLGRAYMEMGKYAQAKEAYQKAVALDAYNAIAKKNLQRLSLLDSSVAVAKKEEALVQPRSFIEEVGKAGVVSLQRLAPPETLAKTVAGDVVYLKIDDFTLTVANSHGEYLGLVNPRIGQRLIRLMKGGNQYSAAVTSSSGSKVTVIIRETYQHPDLAGQLSFPSREAEFQPFLSDRALRRQMEYEEEGEEEAEYTAPEESGETSEMAAPESDSDDEDEEEA